MVIVILVLVIGTFDFLRSVSDFDIRIWDSPKAITDMPSGPGYLLAPQDVLSKTRQYKGRPVKGRRVVFKVPQF
jgi:hypothetical protein